MERVLCDHRRKERRLDHNRLSSGIYTNSRKMSKRKDAEREEDEAPPKKLGEEGAPLKKNQKKNSPSPSRSAPRKAASRSSTSKSQ